MRQRMMFAFGVVGLCVGIAGLIAHYHAPGSLYTLALSAFSGYLGLGALVSVVLFALVRAPAGWVGCAASTVVVVWFVALHVPSYVAQSAPAHGADLLVMTSNLKIGGADPSAVVAAVRSHHVDVLMLEELTPEIRSALRSAGLDGVLPHSVSDPQAGGSGTGLWSRFPLSAPATRADLGFGFVTARIDVADNPVSLAAMHVYGPTPQSQFRGWASDMRAYPRLLHDLPGRVAIVGGDFNATPDVEQFRTIVAQGYADAAEQSGAGFTPTWPADRWYPPLITIDHVLTRGAVARSVDSVEIPGSDHRALVAAIRLPGR